MQKSGEKLYEPQVFKKKQKEKEMTNIIISDSDIKAEVKGKKEDEGFFDMLMQEKRRRRHKKKCNPYLSRNFPLVFDDKKHFHDLRFSMRVFTVLNIFSKINVNFN
jgi:hypothetical protein